MSVWLVVVGPHVNSAWATKALAEAHRDRLHQVNGDQIGASVVEIEVRT